MLDNRTADQGSVECGCRVTGLISVEEALARLRQVLSHLTRVDTVDLTRAPGRVLARDVRADFPSPAFDNAAMDGYAVSLAGLSGQGPFALTVGDRLAAGDGRALSLAPGQAIRIFTGAAVPQGTDAVIMQEATRRAGARVIFDHLPTPDHHIRRAGSDMARGDLVLPAGTVLTSRAIAALAATGVSDVAVKPRPRVALLMTGDEVQGTGPGLTPGRIWDVNTPMLRAELASLGVDLMACRQVADRRDDIAAAMADLATQTDLLITTGGVSVGEEDHMHAALAAAGGRPVFQGVAMKPGKPISAGRIGDALWLGLPGNPVSAYVGWQLFGPMSLAALTGAAVPPVQQARLRQSNAIPAQPIPAQATDRREFRPVQRCGYEGDGTLLVTDLGRVRSDALAPLALADGMIDIPAGTTLLDATDRFPFIAFARDDSERI
ncbi:molybdopterin molybdotransferase MoeA [Rhodobacteraceae bacterium M382]|nr:molybdopterin molybdotransferase MoeA [Rhodobacteraceae bacterium M382]